MNISISHPPKRPETILPPKPEPRPIVIPRKSHLERHGALWAGVLVSVVLVILKHC